MRSGASSAAAAQYDLESFLVRVGGGQHENPVLVPARGDRVDQRRDGVVVIADDEPGGFGFGARDRGLLPADLVAVLGDGLTLALLIVLCGKLRQHIEGVLIGARAVEQLREFGDPAVLGSRTAVVWVEVCWLPGGTRCSLNQYWRCWNG